MINNVIPAKAVPEQGTVPAINSEVRDGIQSNVLDPDFRRGDVLLPPHIGAPLQRSWTEAESFDYCSKLTKSHYENFPVGSVLIPKKLQPAIHSLYAFMRTSDDFSDEDRKPGDEMQRMSWLNSWEAMLADCENGKAEHPVFIALRATLSRHKLPVQWLRDLLHAFKMDVTVRRYATYEDLLTYCRYSANPVGRLILTLFGYRDEELYKLSDHICTALQLANHWQDVAVDLKKDRIYLPLDDMARFGVASPRAGAVPLPMGEGETFSHRETVASAISYSATVPRRCGKAPEGPDEAFKKLMAFEVARTRELFEKGRPLPEKVSGRLKWELRFTWQGGVRILDKIETAHYDVFARRPVVTKLDWALITARSLFARHTGESRPPQGTAPTNTSQGTGRNPVHALDPDFRRGDDRHG